MKMYKKSIVMLVPVAVALGALIFSSLALRHGAELRERAARDESICKVCHHRLPGLLGHGAGPLRHGLHGLRRPALGDAVAVQPLRLVTYRQAFGEYMIYYWGKTAGLSVRQTSAGQAGTRRHPHDAGRPL